MNTKLKRNVCENLCETWIPRPISIARQTLFAGPVVVTLGDVSPHAFQLRKKKILNKINLKRNRSDEPTRFPAHLHGRQEPKAFTFFLLSFSSRESWFLTKRLLERAKVACSQFPVLFRLRTTMSGWALE